MENGKFENKLSEISKFPSDKLSTHKMIPIEAL
jgi:hypothetical protein